MKPYTPEQLKNDLSEFNMTQKALAEELSVSRFQVNRWVRSTNPIPKDRQKTLYFYFKLKSIEKLNRES